MTLPGRKADWLSCTIDVITWENLVVRTLDKILYKVVQQDMGLYSLAFIACDDLVIKVTTVEFQTLSSLPFSKNSYAALITSCFIVAQQYLKKRAPYPSKPGDLLSPILFKAFQISGSVTG